MIAMFFVVFDLEAVFRKRLVNRAGVTLEV
jgi:NADH:ubiquinone oxidoreductase subunit 3 (subunit A)